MASLEHVCFRWSIACVSEIVGAFLWREAIEQRTDPAPGGFDSALCGLAQQRLKLGEDLLDGIEIGIVGRQEEQLGPDGSDGAAYGFAFVAAEIVDDDDIARPQCRHQNLLDISQETFPV